MFARYGIPDVLVLDNGPQFASDEFATFAQKWGFEHIISSPHYPQSNGKEENAVKTVKRLFSKCKNNNSSEFMALLDWRNTPTEGLGSSPAQLFLGRRCKTFLPTHGKLLAPEYPKEESAEAINRQKQRQQHYYDRHTRPLKPLVPGDTVRMRLPGQKVWSPGVCAGLVGPRSYVVKMGNRTFVRNRRHLIKSKDTREEDMPEVEDNIQTKNPESSPPVESETSSEEASTPQNNNTPRYEAPPLALDKPQKPRIHSEQGTPTSTDRDEPRRSNRSTRGKRPDYLGNRRYD